MPGGLQSMESQKVRCDLGTKQQVIILIDTTQECSVVMALTCQVPG